MLAPADAAAETIAWLWWVMFWVLGAVTVVVFALLFFGLRQGAGERPPWGNTAFIVGGGLVVPGVIVTGLLFASLHTTFAILPPESELTIEVTGHQWWWDVRYPEAGIVTANELTIPAGEPVRLVLKSADVIHSFWVPRLNGKMDLVPDHPNEFWIRAAEPGTYRGQCAEFCGAQHARMGIVVIAKPKAEYEAWVAARQRVKPPPTDPVLARGMNVFFGSKCHTCHAIAGTPAAGRAGPDLTHLGSRTTLGAATIAHTPGALAGWIANAQALKPGNHMPRFYLAPEELHALTRYLESLD